jgi:hypothetical protein
MNTPTCHTCDRTLLVGENAWADDWTVITTDGARTETRYTCDTCAAPQTVHYDITIPDETELPWTLA